MNDFLRDYLAPRAPLVRHAEANALEAAIVYNLRRCLMNGFFTLVDIICFRTRKESILTLCIGFYPLTPDVSLLTRRVNGWFGLNIEGKSVFYCVLVLFKWYFIVF